MGLWQVDIFDGKNDTKPIRRGYVNAATEEAACVAAIDALGASEQAEVRPQAKSASALPEGRFFEIILDA